MLRLPGLFMASIAFIGLVVADAAVVTVTKPVGAYVVAMTVVVAVTVSTIVVADAVDGYGPVCIVFDEGLAAAVVNGATGTALNGVPAASVFDAAVADRAEGSETEM